LLVIGGEPDYGRPANRDRESLKRWSAGTLIAQLVGNNPNFFEQNGGLDSA